MIRNINWSLILLVVGSLVLQGCSRISLSDTATIAGAGAGAVGTAVLTTNPAGILTGTVAGGALGAAAVEETAANPEDFGGKDGEINTFYELASFAVANFFNHLIAIGIIAGAIWLITGYIGMRVRRPEEKALEKQMKMLVDKVGSMKD